MLLHSFHNGTESRKMLPVRNGQDGKCGSERLVDGGPERQTYHNGTESRETLPVRHLHDKNAYLCTL